MVNSMEMAGQRSRPVTEVRDPGPSLSRRAWWEFRAKVGTGLAAISITALAVVAALAGQVFSGADLLRVFGVVVLATLPGLLFVRFTVFRAGSLWTEYVLNVHRLGMDSHGNLPRPSEASGYFKLWQDDGGATKAKGSVPSIYQQKFEAYYGQPMEAGTGRPVTVKNLPPVLLATAVLAAGWAAVLARDPLFTGPLELPYDSLRFGFMGAYVFVVQMVIRRFFQTDLKPSAYFGIVARVATVLVSVLVVHHAAPVASDSLEVGTAFLIGFFPLLGMQIVQKTLSAPFKKWVHTLKTPYPLSDLDGLNIWYEARLLEEGIEDLQNLVTGNLVDIILHTKVPVGRLVDWIDQAALQLVLDPPKEGNAKRSYDDRNLLRGLGVRTATDLETMFLPAERLNRRPACAPVPDDTAFLDGMLTALKRPGMEGLNPTTALLRNFANVPNLVHVRHWRDILCTEHHAGDGAEPTVDLTDRPAANGATPDREPAGAHV